MWITVWNAATLNWILCQLWLSTINTINNRKDRLHARKTGCNHSACVAHRPHPPPFPHRIYISKQASVCTAQPLALLRSASLSQSISVSISLSRKHSSLAAQVLGLKIVRQLRAMPTATSRRWLLCQHRLRPLASGQCLRFLQPAATSIYEKLLSSRGQMKWVDIAIAIDVGFNVVSVCLLLLLRQRRQQQKQEEQLVVHSFLFFSPCFPSCSHVLLFFFLFCSPKFKRCSVFKPFSFSLTLISFLSLIPSSFWWYFGQLSHWKCESFFIFSCSSRG